MCRGIIYLYLFHFSISSLYCASLFFSSQVPMHLSLAFLSRSLSHQDLSHVPFPPHNVSLSLSPSPRIHLSLLQPPWTIPELGRCLGSGEEPRGSIPERCALPRRGPRGSMVELRRPSRKACGAPGCRDAMAKLRQCSCVAPRLSWAAAGAGCRGSTGSGRRQRRRAGARAGSAEEALGAGGEQAAARGWQRGGGTGVAARAGGEHAAARARGRSREIRSCAWSRGLPTGPWEKGLGSGK